MSTLAATMLDLTEDCGTYDPQRDEALQKAIARVCVEAFPDNGHNEWHIERAAHFEDRSFVLVRPEPDDAGSDRVVLLCVFGPDGSVTGAPAVYDREGESSYGLLCSEPGCPEDAPQGLSW